MIGSLCHTNPITISAMSPMADPSPHSPARAASVKAITTSSVVGVLPVAPYATARCSASGVRTTRHRALHEFGGGAGAGCPGAVFVVGHAVRSRRCFDRGVEGVVEAVKVREFVCVRASSSAVRAAAASVPQSGVALVGVFGQSARDDGVECRWHRGIMCAGPRHRPEHVVVHQLLGRRSVEGEPPCQHVVEGASERIDVGLLVDPDV